MITNLADVDVLSPTILQLKFDMKLPEGMWACQFATCELAYFTSESEACDFQLLWRKAIGLNEDGTR